MSKMKDLKDKMVALAAQAKAILSEETQASTDEVVAEFMEATLTDGTIVKYDSLEVGAALMVISEEGEVPAPDATHQFEDGTLVTTVDGLITEIVEAAPVVEEDEMFSEFKAMIDKLTEETKQLRAEFSKIKKEHDTQLTKFAEIIGEVSKVVAMAEQEPSAAPAAKPTSLVAAIKSLNKK